MELILFTTILSLLLVHEMDAIRTKEWKMFTVLKDMAEEKAYRVFAIIHLPLYIIVLYLISCGGATSNYVLKLFIDIFLLGHSVIHYGFRNHKSNGFQSLFSKGIIYLMPILVLLHLCLLFV